MLERGVTLAGIDRFADWDTAERFAKSSDARLLVTELARLGAASDTDCQFPSESLALLKRIGAMGLSGSATATGPMLEWLRLVGRGDLSVGRLYEGHLNAVCLIEWYGTVDQRKTLRTNLAAGKVYGVWATEPPPGVTLEQRADGFRLQGRKIFASGAGLIDYAIITAQGDSKGRAMVLVPANMPDRADASHWQVRGMRATMSGSYDLAGLDVSHDDIIGHPGDYDTEPRFTAGAWRFLAVQLGGIEALLTELRNGMSDAARNDPLQRLKFANAVEATRTAQFWVAASARLFESGDADAPAFVRMARGVVERAATEVMNDAARVIGTRSAFDGQRIDKISRDLSLYLRQAGPDYARDQAAIAWLDHDISDGDVHLW